jgi:hypothetical protein
MKKNITLNQISLFTQNEEQLIKEIGLFQDEQISPKKSTIQNILNFSKALQVKKTKSIGYCVQVLN